MVLRVGLYMVYRKGLYKGSLPHWVALLTKKLKSRNNGGITCISHLTNFLTIRKTPIVSHHMSKQTNAAKRVTRDLKDLIKDPLPSIAIQPLNGNIFKLHCNAKLLEGAYSGLTVHFVIDIPEGYPHVSPAGSIAPSFPFSDQEHSHIHGHSICNDYLSNFEGWFQHMDGGQVKAGTGWNPAITLRTLLIVLQPFFADHELKHVDDEFVSDLRRRIQEYQCPDCGHTDEAPVPMFVEDEEEVDEVKEQEEEEKEVEKDQGPMIRQRAEEILVCSISKANVFEDKTMILGYPLHLGYDKRDRLWLQIIPEPISYDQYATQIQQAGIDALLNFTKVHFKTATGKPYNTWLPIFINEEHFNRSLEHFKNGISVISNGIAGTKENDFNPQMVLRVLPALINKNTVWMMKGDIHESESAIYAYCHYLRLFMRFLSMYPELKVQIDNEVTLFLASSDNRNKTAVPDIGEFLIKLALSSFSFEDNAVKTPILVEYFARQIFWIGQGDPTAMKEPDGNKRLQKMFDLAAVSNKLLVFNVMAAKTFIFKDVTTRLDSRFGIPPGPIVTTFQGVIKRIKDIPNYRTLMQAIGYTDVIKGPIVMDNFLRAAISMSYRQRYTRLPRQNQRTRK